jgi:hypothetical protein
MRRFARALAPLVLLFAAAPALAFVRSKTNSGAVLWWRPRQIVFQVNASAYTGAGCSGPADAATQIRSSFPAWMKATQAGQSQACTDFKFDDCGDTTRTDLGFDHNDPGNNVNLVVIRKGNCTAVSDPICHVSVLDLDPCIERYDCWEDADRQGHGGSGTIALTTVSFDDSTGEIVDADMELNGWNGSVSAPSGQYFTCASAGGVCPDPYGDANCIYFDIANTATHEAGHMLGLDHPCGTSSTPACPPSNAPTMAATAAPGDTDKRTLAADDVNGVCTIYPAGQPTTTSNGTQAISAAQSCPSGSKSGGCGSGGGGVASLLALAALLGRRRRGPARA